VSETSGRAATNRRVRGVLPCDRSRPLAGMSLAIGLRAALDGRLPQARGSKIDIALSRIARAMPVLPSVEGRRSLVPWMPGDWRAKLPLPQGHRYAIVFGTGFPGGPLRPTPMVGQIHLRQRATGKKSTGIAEGKKIAIVTSESRQRPAINGKRRSGLEIHA